MNPALQVQVSKPTVLAHVALAWQLCVPAAHSFTSAQETPLPMNPGEQVQVNEPIVSAHVALAWQS